jgi:hypothetical protein
MVYHMTVFTSAVELHELHQENLLHFQGQPAIILQ